MKQRLRWTRWLFLALVGLALIRSAFVQLFPDQRLVKNQEMFYKAHVITVANRGSILDRSGHPLAVSVPSYSVFCHPRHIKEPQRVAKVLAEILEIPRERLLGLMDTQKSFVWLKRKLSMEVKQAIEKHGFEGIHHVPEPARVYPNGTLAAHVLGYTNVDLKGMAGVEQKYDKALEGIPRAMQMLKDARGRVIYVGDSATASSRPGYTLYLTIDKNIQYALEEELKNISHRFAASHAMGFVMDPRSGEILAMAVTPTFDPSTGGKDAVMYGRNRIIMDVYEPGSTLKAMTVAAALEHRVASTQKVYDCKNGRMRIGKYLITDADLAHTFTKLPLEDILKVSSNVCTIQVAKDVGKSRLYRFLSQVGFGQLTGIDLPGEMRGFVPALETWGDIHLATISYGHGISATPMQLGSAYAAFANGGYRIVPHVLRRVEDEYGRLIYDNTEFSRNRIVSEQVTGQIRRMLTKVTEKGGTGIAAAPYGLAVPGKTGTVMKYVEGYGGYKAGSYMSSFVGMFPVQNPEIVLLVLVDEPQHHIFGGEVAAPAFKNLSEHIIRLRSLYPKFVSPKRTVVAASVRDSSRTHATDHSSALSAFGGEAVPSLLGMTLSQVRNLPHANQINLVYQGVGKVIEQFPPAGSPLTPETTIKIVLRPEFD